MDKRLVIRNTNSNRFKYISNVNGRNSFMGSTTVRYQDRLSNVVMCAVVSGVFFSPHSALSIAMCNRKNEYRQVQSTGSVCCLFFTIYFFYKTSLLCGST